MKRLLTATIFSIWLSVCLAASTESEVVKVTGGQIEGERLGAVVSFKGIPFAAPPVGALRWKAPQPVKPWTGIRQAKEFGPSPLQNKLVAWVFETPNNYSEDCLYLNVWTPATNTTRHLPVMVWIYGGAFSLGSTAIPLYDGNHLANKGVVVVSIAYRVGAFGFLAHPELSREGGKSNFGIQDQIAALKWVRDNIAAFGGDPGQVTIFGESAGGESVSLLVSSPRAKGLFQRAIAESGAFFAPAKRANEGGHLVPTLAVAEQEGVKLLAKLNVKDIAAARALPASKILEASPTGLPCYDDDLLPSHPYQNFQNGQANYTPILIGFNSDDGGMFVHEQQQPADFEAKVRGDFGEYADKMLAVYPHANAKETFRAAKDAVRDAIFAWPAWAWARLQAERSANPVYFYCFDHRTFLQPEGAGHGAEISYVFQNIKNPNAKDVQLSEQMSSYWVNFARTGDPNGSDLPKWQPFTTAEPQLMLFGDALKMSPMPDLSRMEAWDGYFAWRRKMEIKK